MYISLSRWLTHRSPTYRTHFVHVMHESHSNSCTPTDVTDVRGRTSREPVIRSNVASGAFGARLSICYMRSSVGARETMSFREVGDGDDFNRVPLHEPSGVRVLVWVGEHTDLWKRWVVLCKSTKLHSLV